MPGLMPQLNFPTGGVMAIDHDQIFKTLIETFFQEFMELFCPGEAELIDFNKIEFMKHEYFTDLTGGRRKQLDLVAIWYFICPTGPGSLHSGPI